MSDNIAILAARFHSLFRGTESAHGHFGPLVPDSTRDDGKVTSSVKVTKREPVTDSLWERHLRGEYGLGVIPVDEQGMCQWGALDLDSYDGLDHQAIARQLVTHELPMLVCRSKSGGAHIMLFASEPVAAKAMQKRLKEIRGLLGLGEGTEVFPKQISKASERDMGSWLNMGYFSHEKTNRYAIASDGTHLSAEEFLTLAESVTMPAAWFAKPLSLGQDRLRDGPPCLNRLIQLKLPEGTWDTGIFNTGIYCRQAFPDSWETELRKINAELFPQWPASGLDTKVASVGKEGKNGKGYFYQCSNSTLAQYCNRTECRKRKHGVGASLTAEFGALRKYDSKPEPLYWWDIDGRCIELTLDDLIDNHKFNRAYCKKFDKILPDVKNVVWKELINKHMETMTTESVPEDASPEGQMWILLEAFCTGRMQAQNRKEILAKKPFTEEGRTYFRIGDFMTYLKRQEFRYLAIQGVAAALRKGTASGIKGIASRMRIGAKESSVWSVPEFARATDESWSLPSESGGF